MLRPVLFAIILLLASFPSLLFASNHEEVFNSVSAAGKQTQPELRNYLVTVETSRIEEMIKRLTTGMPDDVKPPAAPVIKKFWQKAGKGLIYADLVSPSPYVEKVFRQVSEHLAIELNEMLLPIEKQEARKQLLQSAEVKTSDVSLAENLIRRVEITFDRPTDLQEAFYVKGMRLPQKQVTNLSFDIDSKMNMVSELVIMTANDLHLTVEIRYVAVDGGYIPERYQVTSPDGSIDDLFEATFVEVEGFLLPERMHRIIRRPTLQEDLEVFFKGYQINRPVPEDIKARLDSQ